MADTIELIEIEDLLSDFVVPCEECSEEEGANPAKWQANHGNPNCVYLFCDYHKQVLKAFLDHHPKCGHKHIHCKVCEQDFGPPDVSFCPFNPKE